MALSVKKGSFAKSTGGAPASQPVTGVGFTPKFLKLWCTLQTAEGFSVEARFAAGWIESSSSFKSLGFAREEANPPNTSRRYADKALTLITAGEVLVAECDLTSFDADGFTLNWTTNDANAYIIHYEAYGGSDLTNVKVGEFVSNTVIGNQGITGVGFQPDIVEVMSIDSANAAPTTEAQSSCAFGMATGSTARGTVTTEQRDGDAHTGHAGRSQRTDLFLRVLEATSMGGGAPLDADYDFVSQDTDGFTVNVIDPPATAIRIIYVALKGPQFKVGSETQRTSVGTKATTGVGFQPDAVSFVGFNNVADTTVLVGRAVFSHGASDGTTEGARWSESEDAALPNDASMRTVTTKVFHHCTDPSTVDAECDLQSLDSDGFTLDWTTADATAREFLYWAIGAVAGGAALVKIVNETEEVSEGIIRRMSMTRLVNENEEISEGILRPMSMRRIVNETEQITEGIVRPLAMRRIVNETEEISEGVIKILGFIKVVNETEEVPESVLKILGIVKVVNETQEITEGIIRRMSMKRIIDETEEIPEGILRLLTMRRIVNETGEIPEGILRLITMKRIVNETEEIPEGIVRRMSAKRVINETEEVSETVLKILGIVKVIDETEEVTESVLRLRGLVKIINETVEVSEVVLKIIAVAPALIGKIPFIIKAYDKRRKSRGY